MDAVIRAYPTKDFFIQMLTKDIKLERAIIDLIDNSIDGAKRIRPYGNYEDLKISINVSNDEFEIIDNCGGFSLKIAENYAFMFGRPAQNENEVRNSVGRFGVGMKRSLFKMGNYFEVESRSNGEHFLIQVDVRQWSTSDDWDFGCTFLKTGEGVLVEDGTRIKVSVLNKEVSDEFALGTFLSGLQSEIERALGFILHKHLSVFLNNAPLKKMDLSLLESEELRPFYSEFVLKGVTVKVYAGIGEPSPDLAGWYLYCNERLVVEKDKTNLTGWDGNRIKESKVVKYHNIYAMFRGVVFFSSEDSRLLPMTTTKTGIDSNSEVYKAAKSEMVTAMLQVLAFLKTLEADERRDEIIAFSSSVDVVALQQKDNYQDEFVYPDIPSEEDNLVSISFKAEKPKVDAVKSYFKINKNKECGEKVFDYFLRMEGIKS